jgi:hypothetical protein
MAKIKVESQSTGTGIYTLKTGTASTNYSATLPDATGTLSTEKLTTKGDLEVYGTAPDRLAVGTNDYLLTADSTAANGVAWKAAAGGAEAGNAAFSARFSSGAWISPADNATLAFNDDSTGHSFDTDGVYDTTAYDFTAPATGVYLFYMSVYTSNWSDDGNNFIFALNGSDVNFQADGNDGSVTWITHASVANIDLILNATIVIPMSLNDTMEIQAASASSFYSGLSYWGGCRLK